MEKAAKTDSGTDTAARSLTTTGHPTAKTFADPFALTDAASTERVGYGQRTHLSVRSMRSLASRVSHALIICERRGSGSC